MSLASSLAQGELTPLERGMHALEFTERRRRNQHSAKNEKTVEAYADAIGEKLNTIDHWIYAAEVYQFCSRVQISTRGLMDRAKHLEKIRPAPEHCWQALAERLTKEDWTIDQTAPS